MLALRDPRDLSKRALAVLKIMNEADEQDDLLDAEIVCDGLECWVGHERTNLAVVNQLLSAILVSEEQEQGCRRYSINESGKRFLKGLPPYRDSEGVFHVSPFSLFAKK